MTQTEKAWAAVNSEWHPFGQVPEQTKAVESLRKHLRDLQAYKIPVDAVHHIGKAIHYAHRAALESSYCEHCDCRSDGMMVCQRCKRVAHHSDFLDFTCSDCRDKDDSEDGI